MKVYSRLCFTQNKEFIVKVGYTKDLTIHYNQLNNIN
jgi:hypothetical protein